MSYDHTQQGVLHRWFTAIGALEVVAAAVVGSVVAGGEGRAIALILAASGLFFVLVSGTLSWLRVHDDGDALRIAFGPIALFRRRVPYASMRGAKSIATDWHHGIGIHSAPGGGWTWNIRGREAVEVTLERGRLLIGTDDPQGLVDFLKKRARLPNG